VVELRLRGDRDLRGPRLLGAQVDEPGDAPALRDGGADRGDVFR